VEQIHIYASTASATEEELLCGFRELMEPDSNAACWFEVRGRASQTIAQLETAFKLAFGPDREQLNILKENVKSMKQHHSQSFRTFAHRILIKNEELGSPYNQTKLTKIIYRNMLGIFQVRLVNQHLKPWRNWK